MKRIKSKLARAFPLQFLALAVFAIIVGGIITAFVATLLVAILGLWVELPL